MTRSPAPVLSATVGLSGVIERTRATLSRPSARGAAGAAVPGVLAVRTSRRARAPRGDRVRTGG